MLKLWRWYQKCLAVHPVKTQVISSGFIWGAGDVAAQCVTHYTAQRRSTVEVGFDTLWKKIEFLEILYVLFCM